MNLIHWYSNPHSCHRSIVASFKQTEESGRSYTMMYVMPHLTYKIFATAFRVLLLPFRFLCIGLLLCFKTKMTTGHAIGRYPPKIR